MVAQGDDAGAGQGGDIHNGARLEAVRRRSGHHRAPVGLRHQCSGFRWSGRTWKVTMSPGLLAWPEGMFSALAIMPTTLIGSFSVTMVCMAPRTDAAPHISNFISSMLSPGLRLMPPGIKGNALNPAGRRVDHRACHPCTPCVISFPSSAEPLETDRKEPMPSFSISFSPRTLVVSLVCLRASSSASLAR